MLYPDELRYLDSHQWVKVEQDRGTIGITQYGQEKMGEVIYVELPQEGKKILKGESFSTLESVKAAYDVPSPVSGEVIEVNEKLRDNPSLINSDPYGEGWLIKIKLFNLSEVESLLTSSEYEKAIEKG